MNQTGINVLVAIGLGFLLFYIWNDSDSTSQLLIVLAAIGVGYLVFANGLVKV